MATLFTKEVSKLKRTVSDMNSICKSFTGKKKLKIPQRCNVLQLTIYKFSANSSLELHLVGVKIIFYVQNCGSFDIFRDST